MARTPVVHTSNRPLIGLFFIPFFTRFFPSRLHPTKRLPRRSTSAPTAIPSFLNSTVSFFTCPSKYLDFQLPPSLVYLVRKTVPSSFWPFSGDFTRFCRREDKLQGEERGIGKRRKEGGGRSGSACRHGKQMAYGLFAKKCKLRFLTGNYTNGRSLVSILTSLL